MVKHARIPLLHDHHSHPLFYSSFASSINLEPVTDKAEAEQLISDCASKGDSPIALAHGWRSHRFQWEQSEFERLPPAAVFNVSLHSLLINEGGAKVLTDKYGDILGKLLDHDWYEANLRVVLNWFANLNASAENLSLFFEQILNQGVWEVEELLLVDENEIELFKEAGLIERTKFWAAPDTYESLGSQAQKLVTGLKLFTDGALGSRTAALKSPYIPTSDHPDQTNLGMLIYSDSQLTDAIHQCLGYGKALAVHAIGDRAIEQTVTALESSNNFHQSSSVRIEHAQMLDRALAERCKKLGVTLSMQPNFSADSVDYSDRLGESYCAMNNPFRMLIDEVGFVCGEDLIFGSDGMPHGLEFALQQSLHPAFDSQRLTFDEFQSGYCLPHETKGHIELELDGDQIAFDVIVGQKNQSNTK